MTGGDRSSKQGDKSKRQVQTVMSMQGSFVFSISGEEVEAQRE